MPIKKIDKDKILIFSFLAVAVFALIGIFIPYPKSETTEPQKTIQPTASPFLPKDLETKIDQESPKIKISGVEVNNFYKEATEIKKDGFAKFIDKKDYQIMYIPVDNSFLISILSSPFDEIRTEAEKALLDKLKISQQEACYLKVNITTPSYANPEYAGKNYGLSFCENKNP